MKWLRRKGGKKLKIQEYYLRCEALGITDMEAYLVSKIALRYPMSVQEVLDTYIVTDKSFDRTLESLDVSMEEHKNPVEVAYDLTRPEPKPKD